MTPTRISRLRTGTIAALIGDGSLSVLLWSAYLTDVADGDGLTLLGAATTTSVLAGLAAIAAIVLTGQAALHAATERQRTEAAYWRGYGDCAADRMPDPVQHCTRE